MTSTPLKTILLANIGTTVEWAEFSFYGYLSFKISHLFFASSQEISLILTFMIFAISYFARPIGAIFFGIYGDKYGRKKALTISVTLMGFATFLIALLPTYQYIGIWAPLFLCLLKFIQGFSISGETAGAAVFLYEHSKPHQKNLLTSFLSVSSGLGMLIGALMATIIAIPGMPHWAWRIPFLCGALTCLFASYMRRHLQETPHYKIQTSAKFKEIFISATSHNPLSWLKCLSIAAFVGTLVYICNVWWTSYVIQSHLLSDLYAHLAIACGSTITLFAIPLFSFLADKYNNRQILLIGLLTTIITMPLFFYFTQEGGIANALLAQAFYAITISIVAGSMFTYLAEAFPVAIRSTGTNISWNISMALFGGLAPLVAQITIYHIGNIYYILIYMITIAMIASITVLKKSPTFIHAPE